jgi:hypothetical protein
MSILDMYSKIFSVVDPDQVPYDRELFALADPDASLHNTMEWQKFSQTQYKIVYLITLFPSFKIFFIRKQKN